MLFHDNNSKITNKDKELSTSDLIGLGLVSSTSFKKSSQSIGLNLIRQIIFNQTTTTQPKNKWIKSDCPFPVCLLQSDWLPIRKIFCLFSCLLQSDCYRISLRSWTFHFYFVRLIHIKQGQFFHTDISAIS